MADFPCINAVILSSPNIIYTARGGSRDFLEGRGVSMCYENIIKKRTNFFYLPPGLEFRGLEAEGGIFMNEN